MAIHEPATESGQLPLLLCSTNGRIASGFASPALEPYEEQDTMSAFVTLVVVGMAISDEPIKVSSEVEREKPLRLSWNWTGPFRWDMDLAGRADLPADTMNHFAWLITCVVTGSAKDEGGGRFRVTEAGERYLGIYRFQANCVLICWSKANKERPTSFEADDNHYLLALRRVKAGN
jgi:hypothetical protein